ncbi:hypothetical protein QAD02_022941 [Eretmocerus hayati]|uniref:Uncharacterized protein n=1 Tax=Eretmocerus hayati TaxID=131215 RepID=A0ACC2PXT2_9HYME|nr:hypothetical protein QAD02_022941 [Eretmocerus hayati]
MPLSSEFRFSLDSHAKMKLLLALFAVTCAVVATYADNDVAAELTTEYPDSIIENLQDELTSSLEYPDEHELKRESRTIDLYRLLNLPKMVMDCFLELKNRFYYNRRGYKIVFQKDCPEVMPDKITLVPKVALDIIFGKSIRQALNGMQMRLTNTFITAFGLMVIPIDQCEGRERPAISYRSNSYLKKTTQKWRDSSAQSLNKKGVDSSHASEALEWLDEHTDSPSDEKVMEGTNAPNGWDQGNAGRQYDGQQDGLAPGNGVIPQYDDGQ